MDITFNKVGELWEAEFEATADFAIHLERKKEGGVFRIYQRTAGAKYVLVDEVEKVYTRNKNVVDYDCSSLIYPKFIKVVSGTEPTYCAIVSSGEITEIKSQAKSIEITSNGTTSVEPDAGFSYLSKVDVKVDVAQSGGSASSVEYLDISALDEPEKETAIEWASHGKLLIPDMGVGLAGVLGRLCPTLHNIGFSYVSAIGVDKDAIVVIKQGTELVTITIGEYIVLSGNEEFYNSLPRLTESEFYNLESSSTIEFTIGGTTYQAEEGMTWGQWVESSYNTGGYYVEDNNISDGSALVAVGFSPVSISEQILSGQDYVYTNISGGGAGD